ncbi:MULTISPECIES: ABC transporter permease [Psychrilyobacter]|uniref:ABC transporter permease subunit n=1 Tax=Psychrilyobacter piezotolerans TaxID=2293438 RepID=A0ABX9KH35_9FUSO|nr:MULTISPECIES: ABC transporter permease [Psychrilyobacter]MCS5421150.1 ABC transporter permease [Psychrilyobacter sp. S5]NDI77935.1 ABC transporter permease [Psychrilyobacter piezotolerans]RDE62051.1 ABC transporter permease [Psychrilyobacter sp. S5]REI41298.1 ABC transporter permease subunit [Psychrilyobacter piezotolerans]
MSNNDKLNKEHEKIISPTRQIIEKFKHNKLAMAGFISFGLLLLVIVGAQVYVHLTNYDLAHVDISQKYMKPSMQHLFGTDAQGRDLFLRVLAGGWISIQVGLLSTVLSIVLGVSIGATAGFFGGKVDTLIMRGTEIVSSFPFLAIAMTISAIFMDLDAQLRLYLIIFILGFLRWTGLARMVRGQILSLREQEFIVATRALGISSFNQITKHLIPNVLTYVIVSGTLTFAGAILTESSLSYLGLSVTEPIPTWGRLISLSAKNAIVMTNYWWTWIFPGLALFILIMSINVIGEGLRDAVDPKSQYVTKEQRIRLKEKRKREKERQKRRKLARAAM